MLTRAGDGTKVVMTGDPAQIDNPYVDGMSNGLTYAVERFRVRPSRVVTLARANAASSPSSPRA